MLYLIEILHQTTTARRRSASNAGCILSKFYIKPQQLTPYRQPGEVVSYRNSTSNHNRAFRRIDEKRLYLIEILHQTTTFAVHLQTFVELYLIEILHQTTTAHAVSTTRRSCILSKFYIKPQLSALHLYPLFSCILSKFYIKPQPEHGDNNRDDCCILSKFYIKPQLFWIRSYSAIRCILSKFYIKPQPVDRNSAAANRCILSKFYIKPQPLKRGPFKAVVVSYRNSTSNHN